MIQLIPMGVLGILSAGCLWLWWRIATGRANLWQDESLTSENDLTANESSQTIETAATIPYSFSTNRCFLIPLGIFDLLVLLFMASTIQMAVQLPLSPNASAANSTIANLPTTEHPETSPQSRSHPQAQPQTQSQPDTNENPQALQFSVSRQLLNSGGKIGVVFLGLGWLSIRYRRAVSEWIYVTRRQWAKVLAFSCQSWLMILPPVVVLHALITQLVPYRHPTIDTIRTSMESGILLASWLGAVVAAPLFEEFLFRGLLIHWMTHAILASWSNFERVMLGNWFVDPSLSPTYSPMASQLVLRPETIGLLGSHPNLPNWGWQIVYWGPVLISAAFFGMAHWGQGMASIPLTLLGLFLGVLFRQTRSLWPCVLVHMAFNGYTMFWLSLSVWVAGGQ